MSFFGSTTASTTSALGTGTSGSQADISKDVPISQPPEDSVSDISFSPTADFLTVTSWDKRVRIYEVQPTGQTVGKALYEHQAPVLCCYWSKDGSKVASGSVDKTVKLFDVQTGQNQQVASHDAAVRCLKFVDGGQSGQILATASWDKTLKYWDLRQPNSIATVNLPERAYTMDVRESLLVVGTAERHVCIIDLQNPTTIFKTTPSPLKFQTRVVSCFLKPNGYAVGSVEGRCGIQYIDDKESSNNFSFRCHREQTGIGGKDDNVYAVNAISINPQFGTFSTAGSDGTWHFWDKDSRHRLKHSPNVGGPITSTAINRTGNIFAYAVSYDWSKGYQANTAQQPIKVMLHALGPDDMKSKPKKR